MKGKFTLQILEKLAQTAVGASELFEAFLEAGYGASMSRFTHTQRQIEARHAKKKMEYEEYVRLQRRYHNILAWLKHDGLVGEEKRKGGKFFRLTKKGLLKLRGLREREKNVLPQINYSAQSNSTSTIVAFDIPERERRKREWLRFALAHIGFHMIQKSIWIGKVKVQKEFIDDLKKLKIIECVEIFEITKSGSLRHIV
ncbi:MAG: CRISPR-associated endonuclease Cas2 [Candidatus Liptonbacteria bacterium]|nr:CRISPR-associated endonuclease Cas2 [Candidatus Liptonbacteria bacterium]